MYSPLVSPSGGHHVKLNKPTNTIMCYHPLIFSLFVPSPVGFSLHFLLILFCTHGILICANSRLMVFQGLNRLLRYIADSTIGYFFFSYLQVERPFSKFKHKKILSFSTCRSSFIVFICPHAYRVSL